MRALLAILILVGGCGGAQQHWRWTSERGQKCFAGCRAQRGKCGDVCGDRDKTVGRDEKHQVVACHRDCLATEQACFKNCPDVKLVGEDGGEELPNPLHEHPQTDSDCWRLGICGRGECVVRAGKCVKR